jgi:cysteine desulfurase/selenocysteine lyase
MPELTMTIPEFDVTAVRAEFPVLDTTLPNGAPLVFLDSAASAQKPQCVIDKEVEVYTQYYANAYRGDYQFGVRIDEELEAVRTKVRDFIGAGSTEEIIFTSGTTMGVNLVANAWGRKFLQPGDEILLTIMEHHANLVPWQQIARERGAKLRFLPLDDDYRLDLSRLDDFLTDRTRMVAVTGMSNVLGTVPPLRELADAAHRRGALVFVDGAQSVPRLPTNVRDPAVDFLAFSGHKLYGPTGVGVLYGRGELLREMDPFLCGGHMISRVTQEKTDWAELPAKFEAGTLCIAQAVALGTAVDWVTRLGMDRIVEHEHQLLQHALEVLPAVPGLQIYGPEVGGAEVGGQRSEVGKEKSVRTGPSSALRPPTSDRGAILCFTVAGAHPQDLSSFLDRKGVAVRYGHHCTMPLHESLGVPATVRASFAAYNTVGEIDVLVDALHFARKRLRLD